jgi:hypothetical protein
MTQETLVQPPRVATWFVNLFTPFEQSDAISGDLQEEFSEVASKSGIASARRWYWRQSVKTIAHLYAAAFTAAPWSMAAIVVGGVFLTGYVAGHVEGRTFDALVTAFLKRYEIVGIYPGRFPPGFIPIVQTVADVELLLFGCIVAMAAKGREIATTTILVAIRALLGCIILAWMLERRMHALLMYHRLLAVSSGPLLYLLKQSIIIVAAGIIVRTYRNAAAERPLHA